MSIKTKIKTWLITKIAGDTLVILNATLLYKYYPLYADIKENPILVNNRIVQTDTETPFLMYASSIMETVDDELKIKEEYTAGYDKAVKEIQDALDKVKAEKEKEEEEKPDA